MGIYDSKMNQDLLTGFLKDLKVSFSLAEPKQGEQTQHIIHLEKLSLCKSAIILGIKRGICYLSDIKNLSNVETLASQT